MRIPNDVKVILNKLNKSGYEAYVVGGCVRDSLIGKKPKDWDICTNAKPDETMEVFKGFHIIPTGLQHGTITVMLNGEGYEITTYRVDGDYSDGRHPDSVSFTSSLAEDLARRDFTFNAMAYSEDEGIVDLYGGVEDLKYKRLKCVGNPTERFNEDALRIMRAIRFSSVLGTKIEENTHNAMVELYKNLDKIAKERINVEFSKMLCGKIPMFMLSEYHFIFSYIIPEIKPMIGFKQNNPYHWLDVWNHSLHVLFEVKEKDLPLRLAALFHDIGKPNCYVEDENGVGHFYGHADKSVEITEKVLKRLKYSNDIIEEVLTLIKYHDVQIGLSNKFIRRMLNKMPKETFEKLLVLKKADILGQANIDREKRLAEVVKIKQMLDDFKMEDECFSLKQLKINGNDLIKMGFKPGKEMGQILNKLFEMVVEEEIENDYEVLKNYVEEVYMV